MPYIKFTEQEKEMANSSSIVDYLSTHGETVQRVGREYIWEAPSGKVSISGSQWYSQYELVGGGAVNFVQKFFGLSYPDAIRSLLGNIHVKRGRIRVEKNLYTRGDRFTIPAASHITIEELNDISFRYIAYET